MATILLAAAGGAIGASFGSASVLGLTGAVVGRAVGATIGRVIDQKLIGSGSRAVETGRVDRFRLTGASEGTPVGQLWGRMRVAGQIIWASRFVETTRTTGGGKGGSPGPKVKQHSYTVSLAVALCEGQITRVGRIWADGIEIARDDLSIRVYDGAEDQLPDPKMEAVEGPGMVPAYRGTAYVIFEDLDLSAYGNRVPQFSFEVMRAAQGAGIDSVPDLVRGVQGVALIPGTGEYSLATSPVHYALGLGENRSANIHTPAGKTDFSVSLETLEEELPACSSVSLVVSWFGDDLRCNRCTVRPKVEDARFEGQNMVWRAGGAGRMVAGEVVRENSRPVYGGTPADGAVTEAIVAMKKGGKNVVFYPFILMEQLAGNTLTDPWTGAAGQPALPWRGRITLSRAPGQPGSPDRTAAAAAEVAAFFGSAAPGDFTVSGTDVSYSGPNEWSYRRFILHYAHLCAAAGGVGAFCIGSEMRSLTQIRAGANAFPAVSALRALAADVRSILGPGVKIGYAADWSEYFGYHPGNGDVFFHLDSLWADPAIDFIGIDNYMPLSDWRDGQGHADAGWGSIYNLDYLKAGVAGGEGFDWYYASQADRDAQIRTPITDGSFSEPWVWRYKDIRSWWENPHHDRVGGVRRAAASPWVPRSKPVWFTEYGCAAIDKGTNEPNKFLDAKSSESMLPAYSTGRRDDLIQMQYLRAVTDYWSDGANNPVSPLYGGAMVDLARAHVWAWDARPFPQFPGDTDLWADGPNYARGHWISGRVASQPLSSVVAEICERSGLGAVDVSGLYGLVRGYAMADIDTARAGLQPLMIAHGFDAVERDGVLAFRMRGGREDGVISADDLAVGDSGDGWIEATRTPEAEIAGRVRLGYVEAEADYEARTVEAIFPDEASRAVAQSELPMALTRAEGQRVVERWLSEARVARDGARFSLPPSLGHLGAGDVLRLPDGGLYRVDRAERAGAIAVEAVRVEPGIYAPSDEAEEQTAPTRFAAPVPVLPLFLDLPLMRGDELPHAPHLAVTATPWPGSVAVYDSAMDDGYALNTALSRPAIIGQTLGPLGAAAPGLWDRGPALRVKVRGGMLSSAGADQLLNGANLMAIGDGLSGNWELFQFADAALYTTGIYDLSLRLRGQAGTDALAPAVWPAGSYVVLIDGGPEQIALSPDMRELARHYRIGPASRANDDASYQHLVAGFAGNGLRPLSPAHLRARRAVSGDLGLSWIRRTRIGGDNWAGRDVPLGEASEAYLLRVVSGGTVVREVTLPAPGWSYTAAMQVADAVQLPFEVHVAQLSDVFGPGPFRRIVIDV